MVLRFGMAMSRWIVFAGITAMLVTGYFATFDVRGQGFLRSVKHVPADLQTKVETALRSGGMNWARVEMDGQRAMLSGLAPSELDRDDAMETARRAAGRGGALWGGITAVDGERIKLSPPRKPYKWIAKRGNGQSISLSGVVPSQRFKRQIAAQARQLFPKGVEDRTIVASGHPTGDWAGTALIGLQQLQKVQSGEVQFNDGVITLFGQTRDDGERATIETAMNEVKRPFSGSASLSTIDRVDAPPPEVEEPELAPASTVQRPPAADCQKLVDQAMRNNVVQFEPASAVVDAKGLKSIETMANTALMCPDLKLKISGHADGTQLEANATEISRRRALAVSKLMRERGLENDRLVIVGVGAAQPDPDADPQDPAKNRRVEFSVIP
jgi:outer membrane protein OmpA-like peptidoglycan-associated protein